MRLSAFPGACCLSSLCASSNWSAVSAGQSGMSSVPVSPHSERGSMRAMEPDPRGMNVFVKPSMLKHPSMSGGIDGSRMRRRSLTMMGGCDLLVPSTVSLNAGTHSACRSVQRVESTCGWYTWRASRCTKRVPFKTFCCSSWVSFTLGRLVAVRSSGHWLKAICKNSVPRPSVVTLSTPWRSPTATAQLYDGATISSSISSHCARLSGEYTRKRLSGPRAASSLLPISTARASVILSARTAFACPFTSSQEGERSCTSTGTRSPTPPPCAIGRAIAGIASRQRLHARAFTLHRYTSGRFF